MSKIERAKALILEYGKKHGGAASAYDVKADLLAQGVSEQAFWKAWWAVKFDVFVGTGRGFRLLDKHRG